MSDKRIGYVADMDFGTPGLVKVEVKKETPKTFVLRKIEHVMGKTWGFWFGAYTRKDGIHFFDTEAEAYQWMWGVADKDVEHLKKELEEMLDVRSDLSGRHKEARDAGK